MNRLFRFYNQNRYMVWVIIVTVIGVIAIIQKLDKFAFDKIESSNISINTSNTKYSVITGQEIKNDNTKIIKEFISYCNNGQKEEAYEILSDECKEVLYPTLKNFIEDYYNKIFDTEKKYSCQGWITQNNSYTYRIDFVQNMLATGEPSKTSILDYYTIVQDKNNKFKLNINKFVGIKDINKMGNNDGVIINILRKKIYIDYEIYDIQVTNKTQNKIMLDDMQSTKNIYIEDENKQKHYWYSYEILENDIIIKRGFIQEISIKFNKSYNPKSEANRIVFSNINLNKKSINLSVQI